MFRSKVIKKRTKNRETLLRNLRKGIARKEPRCPFQLIPSPIKFAYTSPIYHLYGDLILMQYQDTLITESSLYNNFKIYKQAQIFECAGQKCVRIFSEKKSDPAHEWRSIVETLRNSESANFNEWCEPIINYCERYEKLVQELKSYDENLPEEKLQWLLEMNEKTEKIKQTLFKTFPCAEFKSQFKDGQIQLTEIVFSEKYLEELGYDLESFSSIVFQEGVPKIVPFSFQGTSWFAKLRLEKYLTFEFDGHQSPEFEAVFLMKSEYTKKIKLRLHYRTYFEKGVPGFSFIGVMVARQKPSFSQSKVEEELKFNPSFIELMSTREKEMENFLLSYYDKKLEQRYTNLHKICKIKEIASCSNMKKAIIIPPLRPFII